LKAAAATTEARLEQERTRADRLQKELLELAKSSHTAFLERCARPWWRRLAG
jgi:hypothetical protein